MARRLAAVLCRTFAGLLSFGMSGHGFYMCAASGLRQDSIAAAFFCLLPGLSFPAFLWSLRERRGANLLHWVLAVCYLAVFSVLNWRTCSELGYCSTVSATVIETLTTRPVEAMFAVAIFGFAALLLDRNRLRTTRPHAQSAR